MSHIIIGTAGHIDHGKSALVKRLTGSDPDRLVEEQERGMTIDLGFAFLTDNIAFIDVPGHERFIKNMVAGVSTVDLALLVVAADDGVMPQTREHLDILSLLQLSHGAVAITKIDMVDEEWIDLVEEDVKNLLAGTFLQDAPVFRVSSITGAGVDALKKALIQLAEKTNSRPDRGVFWMPIDRSFTIKGFGTVVTGSVLSGKATAGDTLEILPAQRIVKIRGIQKHGQAANEAKLGDRAALNLASIGKDEIQRGNVLATANYFRPTVLFDTKLHLLNSANKALKNRSRVRVHVGTREILARLKILDREKIEPGEDSYVQIQLEGEAVAIRRDPFVIRQYSPPITIGGGIILDTNPRRHRRFDDELLARLKNMEREDPGELLETTLLAHSDAHVTLRDLVRITGLNENELEVQLNDLAQKDTILKFGAKANPAFYHKINFKMLQEHIVSALGMFHEKEPLRPGMNKAELKNQVGKKTTPRIFDLALDELIVKGEIKETMQLLKLKTHKIELSENDKKIAAEIVRLLSANKFSTPSAEEMAQITGKSVGDIRRVLGALQGKGDVLRMEGDIFFSKESIREAQEMLLNFAKTSEEITVSQFREKLGTTRKYAMALLGYFDQIGVTERVADVRVINKR